MENGFEAEQTSDREDYSRNSNGECPSWKLVLVLPELVLPLVSVEFVTLGLDAGLGEAAAAGLAGAVAVAENNSVFVPGLDVARRVGAVLCGAPSRFLFTLDRMRPFTRL